MRINVALDEVTFKGNTMPIWREKIPMFTHDISKAIAICICLVHTKIGVI